MQVPIVQSLNPELKPEPGPTGHWVSKPFASRAKGSLPLSVERDGSDSREHARAEGSGDLAPVALDEMGDEVVAAGAAAATAATEAVAASSAVVPLSKVALIKAVGSSGATATKLVATGSMSSAGSHAVAASAVAAAAAATSSAGGVGSSQPLTDALLLLLQ